MGREERRLVTCVFVDVVGSTDMIVGLGPERMKRELGGAFAEIAKIVAANGGTVEKYIGDAVYAVFGAPVAHEDDVVRAMRSAEALRAWVDARPAERVPLKVRVGIESGEAILDLSAEAGTFAQTSVGAVVNTAARLQQRAEPGEILVGPVARAMARGAAELEALGEVELKGIGRLAAWRLLHTGRHERPTLPFIGRDGELALLEVAFDRATKGRSVLAIVSGPPGQGKTRLVTELLARRASAARVLWAHCRPVEEAGAFAPLRELLGAETAEALAERVAAACGESVDRERVLAGLAESAGLASTALATMTPAERDDEITQAWRKYLGRIAGERLAVVAVDDIHLADPSVVRLLDRLTLGGTRALVVATARPEFMEASGIRPTGDRFFIELDGLEAEDAARLAALASAQVTDVVARAQGNPLFIVELARAGAGPGGLPLTLQGALGARLDDLPAPDRALLSLAAVAGDHFTVADVAFLARRDKADTGAALARLADLHFLDALDDAFGFHHGLLREAALARLPASDRLRAHARCATGRAHESDAASLAHHWWEALGAPEAEWVWADDPELPSMRRAAFEAHLAAGREHAEHFAIDVATQLLERAGSFADDDRSRAEAEHALGLACQRILRQDDVWRHLRAALDLYRASGTVPVSIYPDLVNAASYFGAFRTSLPPPQEVAALVEEGRAAAADAGDASAHARVLIWYVRYLQMPVEHGVDDAPFMDAAMAAVDAAGADPGLRRLLTRTRIFRLADEGRYDDMAPLVAELGSVSVGEDAERLNDLLSMIGYYVATAKRAETDVALEEALRIAERLGPHLRTHAWGYATSIGWARGDWRRASDLGERTATLIGEERGTRFCPMAGQALCDGAIAKALTGDRAAVAALLEPLPELAGVDPTLFGALPRALLGDTSGLIDEDLARKAGDWDLVARAALASIVLGRANEAERLADLIGMKMRGSVAYRALAEGIGEAIVELRGGPPATYAALREIGYVGWAEILKKRVPITS